jgi:hypothetical protein
MAGEFLPPVVTRLTGDLDDLIAKIEQAKALIKSLGGDTTVAIKFDIDKASLARAKATAKAALGNITVGVNYDPRIGALLGARALAGAAGASGAGFGATNDAISSMTRRLGNLNDRISVTVGHLIVLDAELARKKTDFAAVAAGVAAMSAATVANNRTTATANNGFRLWGTGIRLTSNALHWLVMGTLEVASTAIPALVALGAAAGGMAPTFVHISDTIHNLVVASGSMSGAMRNSVGPVAALSSRMGSLQASMAPDAYIIFGSVIRDLTSGFGAFSGVAQQAGNALAGFATKITQDLTGPAGAQLAGFFSQSVKYMVQWGQVLGNLGHAFLNVMTAMFGVGQVLLDVLVVLSRAFLVLTSNPVAAWLIGVAAAMSAVYRYGRLMVTIWNLLGGSALVSAIRGVIGYTSALVALAAEEGVVGAASLALGDLMTVALGPVGIAIAAIGAVMGVWYLATHNTDRATSNLIKRVQSMPPTVANLTSGIHSLEGAVTKNGQAMHHWDGIVQAANGKAAGFAGAMAGAAQSNVGALTAAIHKQAMELLNLDIGLAQAGSGTGAVAAGENAMAISTALADSKVQQLNQALDQYMQLVTGGTGNLAAFTNSLANIGHVAGSVSNNLGKSTVQMNLNAHQFSLALSNMGTKGASAWTNFDQVLGSTMPQMMDWFRQAAQLGATTGRVVSKAALDMTSEMIKYAGSNKTAQATVLAFAQAQGLNVTKWSALLSAVKKQGAGQADLTKKVDDTTVALGNLTAMAQNASAALNSKVSNSLATAALGATKFQHDITMAAQATSTGMAAGGHSATYWLGLADKAQQTAGADAIKMAQNMSGAAGQMSGAAAQTARSLAAIRDAARQAQAAIDAMHGKTIYIDVIQQGAGLNLPGGGGRRITGGPGAMAAGVTGAPPGWAWVGENGPELMQFRGGETVKPHGQMPAGDGHTVLEAHFYLDGKEIFPAMKAQTFHYNVRNGNRDKAGRVRGVMTPR